MAGVTYQPAVIEDFAARLYKQADGLVFAWALRLGLLAGFMGFSVGAGVLRSAGGGLVPGAIFALVGALLGAAYGREKGFELRLRAQEALCHLQTEINTRRSPSPQ